MRTTIHVNRPVQRSHELNVVNLDVARQWILLFEDARPAKTTPLVGKRVRPALEFRYSPDRFGRRVRSHTPCVVERNPEIVSEWRLRRGVLFAVFQTPLSCDVYRDRRTRRALSNY